MRPLYARRHSLVNSKLQHADFWPRVFANSPADIDEYVRPSDAQVISACLKNITIDRFEVNERGEGEPRSVRFTFEFDNGEDNVWFENDKLVKEFYWRKDIMTAVSGKKRVWEGMVSEPVRINWKEGMDLTEGLLDAACDLADAEKAFMKKENKPKATNEDRLKLKEYESLVRKVAKFEAEVANEGEGDDEEGESSPMALSFFAWFGYRGRDVTAEESARAIKEDNEKWDKIIKGEEAFDEEDEEDEVEENTLADAEIFPMRVVGNLPWRRPLAQCLNIMNSETWKMTTMKTMRTTHLRMSRSVLARRSRRDSVDFLRLLPVLACNLKHDDQN
ncbi:predicted protein [Uncinocarpus reesii 1704]|uniref:BSD domain-containing protein n=1 Tax=Uncinocarpus reesii (strain UAMH 1704) TaxID=336963 RepID=C4JM73_UNCRE|nr:uncharacterized protein UREG_03931 [Uncinocarpus reesii 1704]EEP79085.1 predicted protein [Uncinocarpus reesii 1704]